MHLKNLEKYTFSFSPFNFGYASLCADWVISGYQIQSDTVSKRDIWDKCEIYWVSLWTTVASFNVYPF